VKKLDRDYEKSIEKENAGMAYVYFSLFPGLF